MAKTETENKRTIQFRLAQIQKDLKAPKGQRNTFGNYNYRSCEDITNAVKPLLDGLVLHMTDSPWQVGDRIYIKATASVIDEEGQMISSDGFAREAQTKKKMDEAQITGSASSYARKYALNGLLAIDDTKDSDATNDHGRGGSTAPSKPPSTPRKSPKVSEAQLKLIHKLLSEVNGDREKIKEHFEIESMRDLTVSQANDVVKKLLKRKAELAGGDDLPPDVH